MLTFDLLVNAIVSGILLGGFYAAVTVEITIAFGMLDIVNIAHPVFVIMGSFITYIVNRTLGVDPILAVVALSPLFFLLGAGKYQGVAPSEHINNRFCVKTVHSRNGGAGNR